MTSFAIEPWFLAQTAPGAWADLTAIDPNTEWLPAVVPGTLGAALQALGRWTPDDNVGFDALDVWYLSLIHI